MIQTVCRVALVTAASTLAMSCAWASKPYAQRVDECRTQIASDVQLMAEQNPERALPEGFRSAAFGTFVLTLLQSEVIVRYYCASREMPGGVFHGRNESEAGVVFRRIGYRGLRRVSATDRTRWFDAVSDAMRGLDDRSCRDPNAGRAAALGLLEHMPEDVASPLSKTIIAAIQAEIVRQPAVRVYTHDQLEAAESELYSQFSAEDAARYLAVQDGATTSDPTELCWYWKRYLLGVAALPQPHKDVLVLRHLETITQEERE